MNKLGSVLIGYCNSNVEYGTVNVIVEIPTGGTCSDGFENSEILGVARNEFDGLCLYRSTKNSVYPLDKSEAIHLGDDCNVIKALRDLADALEAES